MTDEEGLLCLILDQTGQIADLDTPIELLKLDSLEFVDLVLQVGKLFNVEIPDLAVVRINIVGDFLKEAIAARLV